MTADQRQPSRRRTTTGVAGLDEVLHGGLPQGRVYLVEGGPGTGKTTMGLQFLMEGVRRGERVLFISLLQTRQELQDVTDGHGWSIDRIEFLELPEDFHDFTDSEQTVFNPGEVELGEVADAIIVAIEKHRPQRLVLDSLSELHAIVESSYQLRRQLVKIKRALMTLQVPCTTLFTSSQAVAQRLPTMHTIVHGAVELHQEAMSYGEPRRRLQIEKVRGIKFDGGVHDMTITTGGVVVYPTLVPIETTDGDVSVVASGNAELDAMFGGGLNQGSTCVIMGTSGAGKSTLASHYAKAMADRGEFVSAYCFDESRRTFLQRSRGLKLGIDEHVESGRVELREPDMGRLSPGELLDQIRSDVTERHAKLLIIDSYTGWLNLMAGRDQLDCRLHELLAFLNAQQVLTLVTVNLVGTFERQAQDLDTSYLADTVVLMRHFEAMGKVRRCISVLKKRHGAHERAIREIELGTGGVRLGPPLEQFSGVLTGSPKYNGQSKDLLGQKEDSSGG